MQCHTYLISGMSKTHSPSFKFEKGSIIAAPFWSAKKRRFLRHSGSLAPLLYPARVIITNGGTSKTEILVRYLDHRPSYPVDITSAVKYCHPTFEMDATLPLCKNFAKLVASAPPYQSTAQKMQKIRCARLQSLRRLPGRSPPPTTTDGDTVKAKWRQHCPATGEQIDPGDLIVKTDQGWCLALPTPPVSPAHAQREIRAQTWRLKQTQRTQKAQALLAQTHHTPTLRRSARIAAQMT
tara:strand:+ start:18431 stop:19144 length:714 start_codon:yes stop_codon:yes gene_type:complete